RARIGPHQPSPTRPLDPASRPSPPHRHGQFGISPRPQPTVPRARGHEGRHAGDTCNSRTVEGGPERSVAMPADRNQALDHMVLVLLETRSLDNLLGHLYGPEDGKTFEGVIGKDLANPIPEWAEHGAERKVVPYRVATDIDSPNPDSGEEYPHTNTQLYNIL